MTDALDLVRRRSAAEGPTRVGRRFSREEVRVLRHAWRGERWSPEDGGRRANEDQMLIATWALLRDGYLIPYADTPVDVGDRITEAARQILGRPRRLAEFIVDDDEWRSPSKPWELRIDL